MPGLEPFSGLAALREIFFLVFGSGSAGLGEGWKRGARDRALFYYGKASS
jgi:hypothetical protein